MKRTRIGVLSVVVGLSDCHPPDQAIYDESKKCAGVMEVGLSQIPSYQLRRAGLPYVDVERAGLDNYEAAMKFGPHVGQTKAQIIAAVTESKQRAMAAYAAPGTPEQRTARLIAAIKECMPKPPKPNE